ncbi:CcmD family protein [Membranicola marinus]|uniref:CcmD family protein n=1 Tax=Membranihabitans marinus TaxID=1227546 RepID=A0A953HRV4_9BACT|nr:CcmD family protein [Membranihabitans marinus]
MTNVAIFVAQIILAGDFMHSMGKMYVVVAVVVLVLLGIFSYLIFMDRKIAKLEKRFNRKND